MGDAGDPLSGAAPAGPPPPSPAHDLPPTPPSRPLPPALAARRSASVVVALAAGAPGEAALVLSASTRYDEGEEERWRGGAGRGARGGAAPRARPFPDAPPPSPSSSDTQIARIDARTGAIAFDPAPGVGTFPTEDAALDFLARTWPPPRPPPDGSPPTPPVRIAARGTALLGYAAGGPGEARAALVATRARGAASLPGGHAVRVVDAAAWVKLPTGGGGGSGGDDADADDWPPATRFRVDGAHYYCDTADVTRPFPGRRGVGGGGRREGGGGAPPPPSWEFVWNRALAAPLRAAGLPAPCPHLVQGTAASTALGPGAALVQLTRSSALHAGTRYRARGLNAAASPGNEIEAEQIVHTPGGAFATWVWRRGTVPVWWRVELKGGGVGEATIAVAPGAPYRGTRRYFRRLQRRYCWNEGGGGEGGARGDGAPPRPPPPPTDPSTAVPVFCVNLLRCAMTRRDELLLSEHFAEGVRRARGVTTAAAAAAGAPRGAAATPSPPLPLHLLNFDWHGVVKELGEGGAVEGLWSALGPPLAEVGVTAGAVVPLPDTETTPQPPHPDGAWLGCAVTYTARQRGLLRFNCADSLDRTSAASYFAAVAALAEQCRVLGITDFVRPEPAPPLPGAPADLPPGWEAAADAGGRPFYLDHTTRTTHWAPPPGLAATARAALVAAIAAVSGPWAVPAAGVAAAAAGLAPAPLAAHAAAHRAAGDAHARLYTASPAMHSGVLGLLTGDRAAVVSAAERAARAGADRVRNVGLSVRRRWANVTGDGTRQAAIDAFLAGGGGGGGRESGGGSRDASSSDGDAGGPPARVAANGGAPAAVAAATTAAALADAAADALAGVDLDGPFSDDSDAGTIAAGASSTGLAASEGE